MDPSIRDRLLGTWALETYTLTFPDGEVIHPYGETPSGRIHYGTDGFMSAHILDPEVPLTGTDSGSVPAVQAARILAGHISYCGSYSFEADTVVHHVELCSHPDWIGSRQVRHPAFEGDRLVIRASGIGYGERRGDAWLRWCRAMQAA